MSLKASIEFLIQFRSLRNIDLFHQGVYMLKASIYQKLKDVKANTYYKRVENCSPRRII